MFRACISVNEREDCRLQTLSQFNDDFCVYVNVLPLGLGNHTHNCKRAIKDFLDSGEDLMLFVEDDIIISDKFYSVLEVMCKLDCISTLYTPTSLISKNRKDKYGVVKVVRNYFFGSQCLIIPRNHAKGILSEWKPHLYFDINIQKYCVKNKIDIMTYLPNPVEHLQLKSTWSSRARKHKSIRYE